MKSTLSFLAFIFLFSNFSFAQEGIIYLDNPSFEGMPTEGTINVPMIEGWHDCGFRGETVPDVHPKEGSAFGVRTRPADGWTYLGMVTRDNNTWEQIGQKLNAPMKKDTAYFFSISLARSRLYESVSRSTSFYANYDAPCKLRIWGGVTACNGLQLLAESPPVRSRKWQKFVFKIQPKEDYQFLVLEAYYGDFKNTRGNLLIDDASHLIPSDTMDIGSIQIIEIEEIKLKNKNSIQPKIFQEINKGEITNGRSERNKFFTPDYFNLTQYEFSEKLMGTDFKIVFYADSTLRIDSIAAATFTRIRDLEKTMSDYMEDSELNKLNSIGGTGKRMEVSDDLWKVLKLADKITEETAGAFDYTAGSLTKLWRKAFRQKELPSKEEIEKAKDAVGRKNIKLYKGQYVKIWKKDTRLDLGGIAKGYAVDEALKVLKANGITRALVDGGGDIAVGDPPPDEASWQLARTIFDKNGNLTTVPIHLNNQAIATSGPTEKFLEIDGQRYSHIIDPRTGYGITKNEVVSVIGNNCTAADAWATALSVANGNYQSLKKGLWMVRISTYE